MPTSPRRNSNKITPNNNTENMMNEHNDIFIKTSPNSTVPTGQSTSGQIVTSPSSTATSNKHEVYTVPVNNKEARSQLEYKYPSNYIKTTKYTLWSFVPVNLFNQFRRFYNIYFLVAAVLGFVPNASAISPFTQVFPLAIVLLATMVKDGVEDFYRYKSDLRANNEPYVIVRNGRAERILSQHITAGDLIIIKKDEQFPCDLLLLSSYHPDGVCYIETSQLDGETNLKRRNCLQETATLRSDDVISNLKGCLECDMPNSKMNAFNGRLIVHYSSDPKSDHEETYPVGHQQLLLRGAQLRNTEYIYGMCVYAGVDTKIFRNLKNSKLKFSTMDSKLNKLLIGMFAYNAILLVVSIVFTYIWNMKYVASDAAAYLYDGTSALALSSLQSMTYFILYTYTIPISLFITMELVRIIQAMFIQWDENMVTTKPDGREINAIARNSNLNEDLGLVEYIFSDKTGTLTQNVMKLARWFVADQVFDELANPGGLGAAIKHTKNKNLELFARCVSVCHSAIVSYDDKKKDFVYEVESPDEGALLEGIKLSDVVLLDRGKQFTKVRVFGKEVVYEVLDLIEFTSDRRKMSVVLRTDEGIHVYCKGADQKIFNSLSSKDAAKNLEDAKSKLYQFSCEGLRTLAFAYAPLSEKTYADYQSKMKTARASLVDREASIAAAAEIIEKDMYLLGCSAIDDKLQDEVPETIEYLLNCGIKLWVLTGDKRETAVNIARSCRLFSPQMHVMEVEVSSVEQCLDRLKAVQSEIIQRNSDDLNGLVINGDSVALAVEHMKPLFLQVANRCHSVVCCRVSPIQKANVVALFKTDLKKIVLSVGDGANDVSMIQTANIGVGIVGQEGAQAVRASDYAIGEFRCLKRLIAVHGRYNNVRQSKLIYYSLYKNSMFITICMWFGMNSGWSGLQIYQETFLALFNVVFTSLPPFTLAIMEQELSERKIYKFPRTYKDNSGTRFFHWKYFLYYLLLPIWHSVVIYFGLWLLQGDGVLKQNGLDMSYGMQAWFASSAVMLVVMSKFLMHTRSVNILMAGSIMLSLLVYTVFMFVCDLIPLDSEWGAAINIHTMVPYYLYLVFVVIAALLPDYAIMYGLAQMNPSSSDIIREMRIPDNDFHELRESNEKLAMYDMVSKC